MEQTAHLQLTTGLHAPDTKWGFPKLGGVLYDKGTPTICGPTYQMPLKPPKKSLNPQPLSPPNRPSLLPSLLEQVADGLGLPSALSARLLLAQALLPARGLSSQLRCV